MSEPLRIGLVAEGPTDLIGIEAILKAVLGTEISFVCTQIQPQSSTSEPLGGSTDASQIRYDTPGWGGVYKWCRELSANGVEDVFAAGRLQCDMLIIHLDVDVSSFTYQSANITEPVGLPLPCAKPCPPASNSAEALREVALSWLSPVTADSRIIWCLPAMNMETWVYMSQQRTLPDGRPVECRNDISGRIRKSLREYRKRQPALEKNWSHVQQTCSQADVFSAGLLHTVRSLFAV